MCGRFTSRTPTSDLADYFGVDEVVAPDLGARFNVAPTDEIYAVAESRPRPPANGGSDRTTRRLGTFRWGLVPFWSKDDRGGAKMINARAEGLVDKPAFRRPFERRRCIVPADGFYEWEHTGGKRKQPWYITFADGTPMAFAGLWDIWHSKETEPAESTDDAVETVVRSCVIITGEPNERVARLHDRMPVVLPREAWDVWLDPTNHDVAAMSQLLVPAPAELFELVAVSTAVNDVRNDGPDLIEPVDVDHPPETLL